MRSWFGQKPKEDKETVDKELYDKITDENRSLKGKIDKLSLTNKQYSTKLNEMEQRIKELNGEYENASIKLGLMANDKSKEKNEYIQILTESVKEILAFEKKLKVLDEKNKKLKEKSLKSANSKKSDIENKKRTIKQIEGDFMISSMSPEDIASMTGKEEEEEKAKALINQSKQIENAFVVLNKMKNNADGDMVVEEIEVIEENRGNRKNRKTKANNEDDKQFSPDKPEVNKQSGWDEEINIENDNYEETDTKKEKVIINDNENEVKETTEELNVG